MQTNKYCTLLFRATFSPIFSLPHLLFIPILLFKLFRGAACTRAYTKIEQIDRRYYRGGIFSNCNSAQERERSISLKLQRLNSKLEKLSRQISRNNSSITSIPLYYYYSRCTNTYLQLAEKFANRASRTSLHIIGSKLRHVFFFSHSAAATRSNPDRRAADAAVNRAWLWLGVRLMKARKARRYKKEEVHQAAGET